MAFEDPTVRKWREELAKRTATCPVCGRRYVPLKSGKMRRHSKFITSNCSVGFTACAGSGRPERKAVPDGEA